MLSSYGFCSQEGLQPSKPPHSLDGKCYLLRLLLAQERRFAAAAVVLEDSIADAQADQQPLDLDLRVGHAGLGAAEGAVGPDDAAHLDDADRVDRRRLAPGEIGLRALDRRA